MKDESRDIVSSLVVMAHFDVHQQLRPHTRRTLQNYASTADRVIVVSTSGLKEDQRSHLPGGIEFYTRPNYGYDFYSYKWGLDIARDYPDFDRIAIANDSFIGPTVPLDGILSSRACQNCDFMGMTVSERHTRHVQSYFIVVGAALAKANAFRRFWRDMVPVSDRGAVIHEYELGLTSAVINSGFKVGSYFQPDEDELALAERRWSWHRAHRLSIQNPEKTIAQLAPHEPGGRKWNPTTALADRVLLNGSLPLLKLEVLRYDPYELGAHDLLTMCERQMPDAFEGVRHFLETTRRAYPFRPGEINRPASRRSLYESEMGYGLDRAFAGQSILDTLGKATGRKTNHGE